MDNFIEAELANIATAISSPSWLDYSIFFFTALNTIAFIWLTIALYKVNKKQIDSSNKLQKDNFKIQLFDKRYSVFETISKTIDILTREDYSIIILNGEKSPIAINKMISDTQKELHKSTILSQAIFSNEIYEKICLIEKRYEAIVSEHFKIFKQQISSESNNQKELNTYTLIYSAQLVETDEEEIERLNQKLNKECPNIYNCIMKYNKMISEYTTFVNNTKVLTHFDIYLKIDNIDNNN